MANYRPWNFSWVVDNVLCAHAFPHRSSHFTYLKKNNVRTLVTLTEFNIDPKVANESTDHGIRLIHMPIIEFQPPSLEQIDRFVKIVDSSTKKNEAVAVHCHWGRGRTGVMVAAYFVKALGLEADAAIDKVREMRPHSVETEDQEEVVRAYQRLLKRRSKQESDEKVYTKQEPDTSILAAI